MLGPSAPPAFLEPTAPPLSVASAPKEGAPGWNEAEFAKNDGIIAEGDDDLLIRRQIPEGPCGEDLLMLNSRTDENGKPVFTGSILSQNIAWDNGNDISTQCSEKS